MRDSGQLTIAAGRIQPGETTSDRAAVTLRPRRSQTPIVLQVDRVVDCTGVAIDYRQPLHPLIENLRLQGLIRPNAIGLGLNTAAEGALIEASGKISTLLYTLGTPRKGDLWETIAVPELRQQAQTLAETLLRSPPVRVHPVCPIPDAHTLEADTSSVLQCQWMFRYLVGDRPKLSSK